MRKLMTESQFYMWRTLFAVAHADNVVTDEEIQFMAHIIEDVEFTPDQVSILKDDIMNAKDVELMFQGVTEQEDRTMFFDLARDLVWVDGDFGTEEQDVMIKLSREHFMKTDVDGLVGNVALSFEDEESHDYEGRKRYGKSGGGFLNFGWSFRNKFAEKLGLTKKPKK